MPIVKTYFCDTCEKEADDPTGWYSTVQIRAGSGEHIFCSLDCMTTFYRVEESTPPPPKPSPFIGG